MLNREGLVVNFCEWKGSERAMVCSVDDLREWSDFPKGLRVLLLGDDNHGAAEIKSTLEGMEYIVSTFYNENEALAAISSKAESFHVAIVEVSSDNSERSFMFLETVKDLPTIIVSNIHCLSTMMKCIALGAVEFLQKPISEDKLKNIWQHVVHKAFNAGESVLSKSLTPIKETVTSMLQLQLEAAHEKSRDQSETEIRALAYEPDNKPPLSNDRFPAPLTPQLEQGGRLLEDGDCLDQTNWSVDQETREHDSASMELRKWSCSDSKSVESTCEKSVCAVASLMENLPLKPKEAKVEEEVDSAVGSEFGESNAVKDATVSSSSQNEENLDSSSEDGKQKKGTVLTPNSCNTKDSKKKMKVDWTPELHRRFVQAVEQLGINQAIPSRILELMKVEGLTRHNVASHLQKYRMHRRHVMPKEDELAETRNWRQQRDPMHRGYNHRPVMAFPLYQSNCGLPTSQLYPVWGHPSSMQMWGHAGFPVWQPPESWHWNIHPGMHAEAWGCPVVQAPNLCSFYPQNPSACHGLDIGVDCSNEHWGRSSIDLFPAEEVVDKALKEAICKPWLPLPLGLKPPSTESVLTELQRRGITGIPPKT